MFFHVERQTISFVKERAILLRLPSVSILGDMQQVGVCAPSQRLFIAAFSAPSRPFFFFQRTDSSFSSPSSRFDPTDVASHRRLSSLLPFLRRLRSPKAPGFLLFSSDKFCAPKTNGHPSLRSFGESLLVLLLILSARNSLASRRVHFVKLPALVVRGLSLKASQFFIKTASDFTNSNGRDILRHRAEGDDDWALSLDDTSNIEPKTDPLVLVEDTSCQEQSAVPAALFVYGRGTANEFRTSYSMIYAGRGPFYDCQKCTDVTLVGKTYSRDDTSSKSSGRNTVKDGNPTASSPGNSEIIEAEKVKNDEDRKLFEAWLCKLEEEAIHRGVNRSVIDKALSGITVSEDILEKDSNQPELKLSADAYIARMVTDLRISSGVKAFRENFPLLNEIAAKYGVPPPILVAIWGVESNYGSITGNWDTVQALITLAYGSGERRARFFREELIRALGIIEQGHGPRGDSKLKGSWAGAMGQCQFMPSSFQTYAIDYDEDGCKDIWESRADALASMANYLQSHGWKKGYPVAQQVTVPETLDVSVLGLAVKKTLAEWNNNYKLHIFEKEESLQNETASLIAPDGVKGRVYLVFKNFNTIMRYNPSVLYALAVHELSNLIANKTGCKHDMLCHENVFVGLNNTPQ